MICMLDRVEYQIRTILCPISLREDDPSWAFPVACSLAQQHDAELILLHVLSTDAAHDSAEQRQAQTERLDELRERANFLKLTTTIVWGEPASAIVRRARESSCDLIVMRPSQSRWLIGRVVDSVSQRVCRLARCPVILVNQGISSRGEGIRNRQGKEPSDTATERAYPRVHHCAS